jgi:hypothetical protein
MANRSTAAVLLVLAAACSGGSKSDASAGTSSETTPATFCTAVFDAIAAQYATCEKATTAALAPVRTSFSDLICTPVEKAVAAGRAKFDAAAADRCIAALKAATCEVAIDVMDSSACTGVVTGTVANGGACYDSLECTSGSCSADAACPGTCVAFLRAGDACGDTVAECGPGLECGPARTCVTPSQPGGPCPCVASEYCDSTSTCRAVQTSGACTASDQCAFGWACAGGACLPYVGVGADCTPGAMIWDQTVCGPGTYCTQAGKCALWPTVGESCATYPVCAPGYCDPADQMCKASKPKGSACSAFYECETLACEGNVCVLPYCAAP